MFHIRHHPIRPVGAVGARLLFAPVDADERGAPDLFCFLPDRGVVGIECKSSTGSLTDEQRAWGERLVAWGHRYLVVRSLDDLVRQW